MHTAGRVRAAASHEAAKKRNCDHDESRQQHASDGEDTEVDGVERVSLGTRDLRVQGGSSGLERCQRISLFFCELITLPICSSACTS